MVRSAKRNLTTTGWIDVSVPLRSGMVHWPGDNAVRVERLAEMAQGHACNLSVLAMGAHTATHVDAPFHFIADGDTMDEWMFDATCGCARVIEIHDPLAVQPEALRSQRLRRGERILFKTRNSRRCWRSDTFVRDYVHVTPEAAQYLIERGVRTVGIDYLSVGAFEGTGAETHRILLGAGVWIIEGLDLSRVPAGSVDLLCMPLRLAGADGAPARALVRCR